MPKSCGYMLSRIPGLLPQSRPGLFTQKLWEVFGLLWIAVAADSLCCLSCTPTPTFQGTLYPIWWATWGKGLSRGVSCIKLHWYSIFFFSAPWRREWPPTPVFWPGEFFPEPSEKKVADIMPLMSWSFNVFLCISCKQGHALTQHNHQDQKINIDPTLPSNSEIPFKFHLLWHRKQSYDY